MRTNSYLQSQLNSLCTEYFSEINPENDIQISFGRKAKQRLGSIKRETETRYLHTPFGRVNITPINPPLSGGRLQFSIITITGYFRDEQIPDYVVQSTIAHELVHYVHGFSSPMPQLYKHPHKGKVVQRELIKRGLGDIHYDAERWLRKEWQNFIAFAT